MNKKITLILAVLVCMIVCPFISKGQQNSGSPTYPFPQNRAFANGFKPTTITGADATAAYNDWKASFAENCSGTWRIKFDNSSETVSEGIAYGMLLAAFHADKTLFDGLWLYYKNARNSNGVMHWKRGGCANTAIGNNGATDAELDAAFALIIASCQWPATTSYKTDATALINAIKNFEIESGTYILKPGDMFGGTSLTNPSYFAPAYYRVYAQFVPADAAFWNNVASKTYTILNANANSSTGLVSDWCNGSGSPGGSGYAFGGLRYHYDAARTPWRIATDYIWWGNTTAQAWCTKVTTWVNGGGGGIANIGDSYEQNGTKQSNNHNSTFTGGLACAALATSATNANNFAANFKSIPSANDAAYFQRTIRAVYYLLMTGNFWYPCGTTPTSGVTTSITAPTNNKTYTEGGSVVIDATAATTSGSISKVEFYQGTTKLGEDLTSPYSFTWTNVPAGKYDLKVIAYNSSSQSATSSVVTIDVYKSVNVTGSVPIIDGVADALWANYTASSTNTLLAGAVSSTTDLSATFKTTWDATNLYVFVQVTDEAKVNDSGTAVYEDDGVELYIDISNSKASTYGANDYRYSFRWNDLTVYEGQWNKVTGVTFGQAATANGYAMEIKLPWSTLGQSSPAAGILIGLDVHVNDDDNGSGRDGKLSWTAATDDAWQNPSLFGTVILAGTVSTAPVANFTSGAGTVCTGSPVTFTNSSTGTISSYAWDFGSGATPATAASAGPHSVTWSTGGTKTISLSVTGSGGSNTKTAAVTVNALPIATITAGGSTTFCTGGNVALNANTGSGYSYQWKNNGTNISNATAASYTATASGSYTVTVTSNGCSATSSATTVTVSTPPTAAVTAAGPTTFCSGGSVVLNANSGTGYTYQWKNNGTNISNATTASYTATASGSYSVAVTSNGCSATSSATTVTVNTAPAASISAGGSTTFCTGANVVLNANTGSGYTYQWKNNATNITGATAASYTATASGSYTVAVTSSACSATSGAIAVTATTPPVAIVSPAGAASICSGGSLVLTASVGTGYTYQWLLNGNSIANAGASNYIADAIGNYSVIVSQNGCSGTSVVTTVSVASGLKLPLSEGFENNFAPAGWQITNPGNGRTFTQNLTVGGDGQSTKSASIQCFGYTTSLKDKDGLESPEMDLSDFVSARLTFKVAYTFYKAANKTRADSLNIYISSDCGATYNKLYSKGGALLKTSLEKATAFTPLASEWRTDSVDLSAYIGKENVKIQFEVVNGNGNNLYLDDINIDGVLSIPTGIASESKEAGMHVFPNPVAASMEVAITGVENKDVKISILNTLGQEMIRYDEKSFEVEYHKSVDISLFPAGVYFLHVTNGENKWVNKIIKQ